MWDRPIRPERGRYGVISIAYSAELPNPFQRHTGFSLMCFTRCVSREEFAMRSQFPPSDFLGHVDRTTSYHVVTQLFMFLRLLAPTAWG